MAVAEVGTGTGSSGSYGTGVTVTRPGSLATADVVVIVLRTENTTAPNFVCTGFTRVVEDVDTTNQVAGLTVLVGSGFTGTGSFTVTSSVLASGDWVVPTCTAWSGTDGSPVVGALFSDSPGGADFLIPSVTTTSANAVVLAVGAQPYVSVPRTFTPTFTAEAGADACFQASRSFASAGATGTVSCATTSYSSAVACLIALHEASSSSPISGSDTGSGADAQSIVVVRTQTETGAGTDTTGARTAARTATETGAGVDTTGARTAARTQTETGAGADANGTPGTAVGGSDTGSGLDTATARTSVRTVAETGSGLDAQTLVVVRTGTDTGAGADNGTALDAGDRSVSSSDTGTGGDAEVRVAGDATAAGEDSARWYEHELVNRRPGLTPLNAFTGGGGDMSRRSDWESNLVDRMRRGRRGV